MREHDGSRGGGRSGRDRRRRRARRPEADRPGRAAPPANGQLRHLGDHRRQQAGQGRRQAGGRPAPDLQLPRLLRPGHAEEVREGVLDQGRGGDLQLGGRGGREALVGGGRLRPDRRADRREHRRPDRAQAAGPAQPLLPAQPREEHLAGAGRSLLRPRQPLHGPVRRLDGRHRLAQRPGQAGRGGHGRSLGHLLGVRAIPRQGGHPRRPPRRAQHADAARRDARRHPSRPQHGGARPRSTRPRATSPS